MSYRCGVCTAHVCHGEPRKVHIIERVVQHRTEIAQEIPVCAACKQQLINGETLADLKRVTNRVPVVPVTDAKPPEVVKKVLVSSRLIARMKAKQSSL